ncbi:peptidoglycan-binding protein LysM [Fructobacillus sp. M2-14]|uniref:Peptidoglycan-binding protein LysM n=1 Tax=Fructobacillus broussonetiae TaxID=2713173 RepID=A0ABS5R0F2_9LACO|nr:peptidoglycan-binding protein LysM [Fructobacillus broussonetiae]MBS9338101.1 peptidoglycan-binding protein LysM [Fructobacillus broussonetiae]
MNNDGAILSRKNRFEGSKKGNENQTNDGNHGGLLVFLVFVSLFLLASAPVYGMVRNQPKLTHETKTSSSSKSDSKKATKSSTSNDDEAMESSSDADSSASSSSSAQSAQKDEAAADANSAVLGANQTLYNFAVTHNTNAAAIINLNPGLTTENYSQYAGQSLKIK